MAEAKERTTDDTKNDDSMFNIPRYQSGSFDENELKKRIKKLNELMNPQKITIQHKKCYAQIVACFLTNNIHRYYYYYKSLNNDGNNSNVSELIYPIPIPKKNDKLIRYNNDYEIYLKAKKAEELQNLKDNIKKPFLVMGNIFSTTKTDNNENNNNDNNNNNNGNSGKVKRTESAEDILGDLIGSFDDDTTTDGNNESNIDTPNNAETNEAKEDITVNTDDDNTNDTSESKTDVMPAFVLKESDHYGTILAIDVEWAKKYIDKFCDFLELDSKAKYSCQSYLDKSYVDPLPFFEVLYGSENITDVSNIKMEDKLRYFCVYIKTTLFSMRNENIDNIYE